MKSFQGFLNERRSEDIEKLRKGLENIPTLSDAEMRSQNPTATAAYEKEVARKKTKAKVIKSPEATYITNMPAGSRTPEETFSRLETKSSTRPPVVSPGNKKVKKRIINKKPTAPKPEKPTVTSSDRPQSWQGPERPPEVKKTLPVKRIKSPQTMTPSSIGRAFDQVLKNREARKSAEKAAKMTKFVRGVNAAGTALSAVGSGLEAKGGYETARREGASQRRALGAGAARGLGSFIGGGVGATLGSALGLPGAIAGGAAGYNLGANVGTAAYKAVTGDIRKKLTTQGLKTNIRKAVPYEIRKQVPAGARKAFGDFITQAGKQYGNWSRSQQGGNK